jgi:putative ABC transport system ATP-binding protein
MSEQPVIEFRDVRKSYVQGRREVRGLDGVSLVIRRCEFACVMGPSGSGKSTFLHLAGALDVPSSGQVLLAGSDTRTLDDAALTALRRRQLGFVFQFFNLLPSLPVLQNACLPALLDGRPTEQVRDRAAALLKRFGLGDRLDHLPDELSGGEMQRVAIARALVTDPPLLLADEPTGNLDSATGKEILSLFQEIARERTIVMVTHDERASAYGTRTIRLRDGRLDA